MRALQRGRNSVALEQNLTLDRRPWQPLLPRRLVSFRANMVRLRELPAHGFAGEVVEAGSTRGALRERRKSVGVVISSSNPSATKALGIVRVPRLPAPTASATASSNTPACSIPVTCAPARSRSPARPGSFASTAPATRAKPIQQAVGLSSWGEPVESSLERQDGDPVEPQAVGAPGRPR
jgi:hypothetical protein